MDMHGKINETSVDLLSCERHVISIQIERRIYCRSRIDLVAKPTRALILLRLHTDGPITTVSMSRHNRQSAIDADARPDAPAQVLTTH